MLLHSVELGVLTYKPDDPQVQSVVVYRDDLHLVVNPRHAFARSGEVSIRQLGTQNFVAHNIPSPQRQKVIQTFRRHKTPLQMGVELPSLEAIKRFVEMGNGVALVPGLTVKSELAAGTLVRVRIKELQFERRLRLVYRKQASLSHAALAFLKVVEVLRRRPRRPLRLPARVIKPFCPVNPQSGICFCRPLHPGTDHPTYALTHPRNFVPQPT